MDWERKIERIFDFEEWDDEKFVGTINRSTYSKTHKWIIDKNNEDQSFVECLDSKTLEEFNVNFSVKNYDSN